MVKPLIKDLPSPPACRGRRVAAALAVSMVEKMAITAIIAIIAFIVDSAVIAVIAVNALIGVIAIIAVTAAIAAIAVTAIIAITAIIAVIAIISIFTANRALRDSVVSLEIESSAPPETLYLNKSLIFLLIVFCCIFKYCRIFVFEQK